MYSIRSLISADEIPQVIDLIWCHSCICKCNYLRASAISFIHSFTDKGVSLS